MSCSDTFHPPVPARRTAAELTVASTPGPGFGAHLLGQAGGRRGLRGGEPVLKGARAAYLGAQWRGEADRRPPAGLLACMEV